MSINSLLFWNASLVWIVIGITRFLDGQNVEGLLSFVVSMLCGITALLFSIWKEIKANRDV